MADAQQPEADGNGQGILSRPVRELRRSLPALKGHVTRRIRTAEEQTRITSEEPTRVKIDNLRQALARLDVTKERYNDKLVSLQEMDNDRFDEYEAALESLEEDFSRVLNNGTQVISNAEAGLTQPAEAPAAEGRASAGRAHDLLRPFLLSLDHRPSELRSWVTRFEAYFKSGNLQTLSRLEQQEIFFNLLDPKLEVAIRNEIGPATPIIGEGNTCIGALEKEFLDRYPV